MLQQFVWFHNDIWWIKSALEMVEIKTTIVTGLCEQKFTGPNQEITRHPSLSHLFQGKRMKMYTNL